MRSFGRRDVMRGGAAAAVLATPFLGHGSARAQSDWPTRPVRFIIPFTAGGAGDTAARAVGAKVAEILGQNVIIENRTGGNAVVAANAVLQAPPDGYTYFWDAANQVTNPVLVRDLPFDYRTAFLPVSLLARFPQVLAVKTDFPARTLAEFIAVAKQRPGTIVCGTPPTAGMGHLAVELLQLRAAIRLVHTGYRGGADAARDITAGHIDSVLLTSSTVRGPLQAGKVRILALTSPQRIEALPDVPTFAEQGFPGYEMDDWNGLLAHSTAPRDMLPKLNAAIAAACRDPGVLARMAPLGTVLVGGGPAEFAAFLDQKRTVIEQIIRDAAITLG
jgi:tripartite-type tricarboxylate transporter receptor subunit TctC